MRRCVTVREVAQTLGIQYKSARKLLKRLERRGVLNKKTVGRVAMYCGDASLVESLLLKKRNRKVKGWERLTVGRALLRREGCVSTYALRVALGVGSEEARYTAAQLVEEGEAVGVVVGRTAIWCRDRAAAEETIARFRETIHRLAVENGMRYVTPTKILQVALRDRDAYELLSRFVPLSRGMERFPPLVLTFVRDILESLYGEPMKLRRKTVYVVSQPRKDYTVNVTDSVDKHVVRVNLPDDLATALQGVDVEDLTLQAIEQLLQRYRP